MRTVRAGFSRPVLAAALLLAAAAAPAGAQPGRGAEPWAEVDGEVITREEVEQGLAGQLAKLEDQIHRLTRQRLEALIATRLLEREARRRGIRLDALVAAEVTAKADPVAEEEVERLYRTHRARLPDDEVEARAQVREFLKEQKLAARRAAFVRGLREGARVTVRLPAPAVRRVSVATAGAPSRGPAAAPVTIVEFSDFHCPFCRRVLATLNQLEARYGDRLRLVFRDYPIDGLHPGARRAHEAARCAHEQGRFWPYHDVLFAEAPRAAAADLEAYARRVGLALEPFRQCLESGRQAAAVRRDIEDGERLGVTGTPAFFINGRPLTGAQPLEAFVEVIEEELRRAGR